MRAAGCAEDRPQGAPLAGTEFPTTHWTLVDGSLERGGGPRTISFEDLRAEERCAREPQDPERLMLHRLRGNFRGVLGAEVARTVLVPEDVPGEMEWLKSVLAAP